MKKKLSVLVVFMLLAGCAGISISPQADVLTALQKSAISTVGYLVAENNPDYIPEFKAWYENWQGLTDFNEQQIKYQAGAQKLADIISGDPFLQMQIKNAMSMLDISFEGPQVPGEMETYLHVIDYFMVGVYGLPG